MKWVNTICLWTRVSAASLLTINLFPLWAWFQIDMSFWHFFLLIWRQNPWLREPGWKNVWNTDWCICPEDVIIHWWPYVIYDYDHSVPIKISERFGIHSTQVIHLLSLQTGRGNHSWNVVQTQPKCFLFLCFYRKDCDCTI